MKDECFDEKSVNIPTDIVELIYTQFHPWPVLILHTSPIQRNHVKFVCSIYYGKCVKLLFNQKIIVLSTACWRHQRRRLKRTRRNLPRFDASPIVLQTGSVGTLFNCHCVRRRRRRRFCCMSCSYPTKYIVADASWWAGNLWHSQVLVLVVVETKSYSYVNR